MDKIRHFEDMDTKRVGLPVSLAKVVLRHNRVRALKVLFALKYCLGTDSNGHVDLSTDSKEWLASLCKASLRSINRDLQWLSRMRMIKKDKIGWRVVSTARMHWHIANEVEVNQRSTFESTCREGKNFRGKKRISERVKAFRLFLNFITVDDRKLKDILSTCLVGANLRAQFFVQLKSLSKIERRVAIKGGDIDNPEKLPGQSLTGETFSQIVGGISTRKAYALMQNPNIKRTKRELIIPGIKDEDLLLDLGRKHFGIKKGGIVYVNPDGCLVFRTSDLLSSKFNTTVSSDKGRKPHWLQDRFSVGGKTLFKKDHFDSGLSELMNSDYIIQKDEEAEEEREDYYFPPSLNQVLPSISFDGLIEDTIFSF